MQGAILKCGSHRLVSFDNSDIPLVRDLHSRLLRKGSSSPDQTPWTAEKAADFLRQVNEDQESHGFSRWKVISPEGTFLGWAGFSTLEETSEVELSYCLDEKAVERDPGLPVRLCEVLINWFFENTYFSHLVALVRTDNKSGREVLQDVGFGYRESRRISDMPCDLFQMLSPAMQTYVLTA